MPQGYLKLGPGFNSIPERTKRLERRSACLGDLESLIATARWYDLFEEKVFEAAIAVRLLKGGW